MSRYPIKRSRFWSPALLIIGATENRSFLDVGSEAIVAQFGWKRIEISRSDVINAEPATWPWWGGIGLRSDLRHSIGLIGALSPIVVIHVKPQRMNFLGIPYSLTKLYLSVDDPDAIVRELSLPS